VAIFRSTELVDIIIISATMVQVRLRLDDEVFDWLHAEAARLNVDVSTVVRRALRGERRSNVLEPPPARETPRKVAARGRPSRKVARRARGRR
jgi:hypothetical protein